MIVTKKEKAKKLGKKYVPKKDKNGKEIKHTFDYGDYVATKV